MLGRLGMLPSRLPGGSRPTVTWWHSSAERSRAPAAPIGNEGQNQARPCRGGDGGRSRDSRHTVSIGDAVYDDVLSGVARLKSRPRELQKELRGEQSHKVYLTEAVPHGSLFLKIQT